METKRKSQSEFVRWFGPLIEALKQLGGSAKPREAADKIAENLKLTDDKLNEILSSGQSRYYNQVAWARQYLAWEGLLDTSQHGIWALSSKGENTTLSDEQAREIFLKWVGIHQKSRKSKTKTEIIEEIEHIEPEDIQTVNKTDLLEILQSLTPEGFEKICQRLLRESGFEKVVVTGQSHDGGIDGYGTLEMNPFVSFKVLFQCKR